MNEGNNRNAKKGRDKKPNDIQHSYQKRINNLTHK